MYLKLASRIWCHFVSNLQRYDTISSHVPKRVWQFASEKRQYTGMTFIYEPRSDKRDLLAIKSKSEIFSEKEKPSFCEQLQKI